MLRALEPADLPALDALCARPEIADELDALPGEASLQSAPGVNAAIGAFEHGALVGAAGMSAAARPRLRHAGRAWLASGPEAAEPLLRALCGLAHDWWHLDRLELVAPASTRLAAALAAAGFEIEVHRRHDLAYPGGYRDSVGWAWVQSGSAAGTRPARFPRRTGSLPAAGLEIRASRPEDAAGLARLFADEGVIRGTLQTPFTPAAAWRARLQAGDPARTRSFVALVGDELVGSCNLSGATTPRRQHVWMLGMGVAAAWQGRGVGRALMQHLLSLSDSMGIERVELDVYADNARAIALYERSGFVREGVKRREAWRDAKYVDALVMARLR